MNRLWLHRGLLIDPASEIEQLATVRLDGSVIGAVLFDDPLEPLLLPGDRVFDASNLWILPGLIDLHTHLREPGEEHKETFASGGAAAAAGGFTSLLAMANTQPATDTSSRVAWVRARAAAQSPVRVDTVGAVSLGLAGGSLSDAEALQAAGAVALSDDGRPIENPALMRRALAAAGELGLPILAHEEELRLVGGGCVQEGATATRLGLAGIPSAAEEVMVRRDLALLELTGGRLHLQHVSTAGAVRALREAKARGLMVTGEAAPHHFTLVDLDLGLDREGGPGGSAYSTNFKMNPPLRGLADRAAVQVALADGTLDAIATDHAPHSPLEKDLVFEAAANGIIGLETALPLGLALVRSGRLTRRRLVELFTSGPARVLPAFAERGTARVGAAADLTVVDPELAWTVEPRGLRSKSKNSPFLGWQLRGKAVLTIVGGRTVYGAERLA